MRIQGATKLKTETEQTISAMRTKAWLHEVAMSCTPNGGEKPTPNDLRKRSWKTAEDAVGTIRFDRFADGTTAVSEDTVLLVDRCLEHEAELLKKQVAEKAKAKQEGRSVHYSLEEEVPEAPLFPCSDVFLTGPDGIPFWKLFDDECSERVCLSIIADWLYPIERGEELKRSAFVNKPFSKKVDELWLLLVKGQPVDFDGYDKGEEPNWFYMEIERGTIKPDLGMFAVLLAARHVSEKRKEARSDTRYMFDVCFGMLDLFDEWGIQDDIIKIIDIWQAPTNPVTIAYVDDVVENELSKQGVEPTCPAGAGLVARLLLS